MVNVKGYNYPANSTVEYKRFNSDYYTGADVRIYFGDIWVDEINNLQFMLQENVAPIYGFCSHTWNRVARGTRQISGSFTINFKESYYLHSVLERLDSNMSNEGPDEVYNFNYDQFTSNVTVEQLMSKVDNLNFDAVADQFEKSLWGQGSEGMRYREEARKSGAFFTGARAKDMGLDNGFNILITYGPYSAPDGRKTPETVHSLVGVHITGVSQVIGLDGRPIEEQYTFIAKDLDAKVN